MVHMLLTNVFLHPFDTYIHDITMAIGIYYVKKKAYLRIKQEVLIIIMVSDV